jgi:hypothetical protein
MEFWAWYLFGAALCLAAKLARYWHHGRHMGDGLKAIWDWFFERSKENAVSWLVTVAVVWAFGAFFFYRVEPPGWNWLETIPLKAPFAFIFGIVAEIGAPNAAKWLMRKAVCPPGMPSLFLLAFALSASGASAQDISLAWDASPSQGVLGYNVYADWELFDSTGGLTIAVPPEAGRTFYVTAFDDYSESAPSNSVTVGVIAPPHNPRLVSPGDAATYEELVAAIMSALDSAGAEMVRLREYAEACATIPDTPPPPAVVPLDLDRLRAVLARLAGIQGAR